MTTVKRKRIRIVAVQRQGSSPVVAPFEGAGYAVIHETVQSLPALRRALATPKWDLVLFVPNPRLSAVSGLGVSLELAPDVPFVVASDALSDALTAELIKAGASDVVPLESPRHLIAASERALRIANLARQHQVMQRAFEESETRFQTVAWNIPGMIYQMQRNAAGAISLPYVSEGTFALLGILPDTLRAEPSLLMKLIAPDDLASFRSGMDQSASELQVWNWEGRILFGEQHEIKWVNLRATPRALSGATVQWEGMMWNITQSKLAEQAMLESRGQLEALTSHLETVKERERANIAREIHDDIGGTLTAIKIDLLWLAQRVPRQNPELSSKFATLESLVDHAMNTSTRIARDLRPVILDFGIVAAIEWQAEDFRKRMGVVCDLKCASSDIELEPDVAMAVFRIFQETLTNIAKHARATRVDIRLGTRDGWLVLHVADNGRGFAPRDLAKQGSFGIRGMRERARHLRGDVDVHSARDGGTVVTVRIPLRATANQQKSAEYARTSD